MNHHKCILLIVLFIIVPFTTGLAGEMIIYSSEGTETLSFPDSEPLKTPPDNKYKKIEDTTKYQEGTTLTPKLPDKRDIKKSEVISFKTFDVDHTEVKVRGYVEGSSNPLAGGLLHANAKVIPIIERCAYVVFRNNARPGEARGKRLIREWNFKAIFANGAIQEGMKIETNSYSIREGETGTANICFGINDYPIVGMDCDF